MRRRSSANQESAGVSLFPFLAVLLCTMGALIVVLVVIARHAHLQVAEAARRAADEAARNDLAMQRENIEWRISELTKSRAATKKQLDEKQLELSHIEEHARRLHDKLEELASAKEHFHEMAAGDAKENDELKARLARLRGDADRTKAQINDLRAKAGPGGESYAIIPYHGPNETFRRPLYIECRKEGVILQPEGIVLTEDDFLVDLGPSNPLVSALRAARDYHARNQLMHRAQTTTPYPLFLIRPDGIEMSYHARSAMISWGPEFGYELIGQDWPLEYPPPEPMLALAMKQAVSEGRMRQAYIASAAPMLSRAGSHATFRASAHGGITQVEGSPMGGGRRGNGRPRGIIHGRRGIGGGALGGTVSGGGGGTGGSGTGGGGLVDSGGGSGDGPVHSIDGGDNPYESALASSSSSGRYGRGGTALAGNYAGQPGGRYGGPGQGGYLPGGVRPPMAVGANGFSSSSGPGNGSPGNGIGGGQGARSVGNGLRAGPSGAGGGQGDRPVGSGLRAGPPGNGRKGTGGAAAGGTDGGEAGGDTFLAQANSAGGAGGIVDYASAYGLGGGKRAMGRGGNGQQEGSTANGTDGRNTGRYAASGRQGAGGGTGTPGKTGGKIPDNTGATGPGGPYRMAAAGTKTKGSSGIGNSDLTGGAAGGPSGAGLNAPASPNGFAGGSVVSEQQASSPAAKAGGDGTVQAGSGSPVVLSESRGAVGGATEGDSSGGTSAGGNSSGGNSAGGNAANSNSGGGNRGKSRGQTAGGTSGGAAGGSSSSSALAAGQQSAMGGSSSSMQAPQGGSPSIPMPNLDFGQRNSQAPESIAKKRDRNWANPDAGTSSIPIERPLHLVCDADHLTLLPEGRGRQGMRVIPFKRQTVESVDDLVSTVWDRIDSWGTAGRGMYWRPVLLMEVEPGGQRRYAELQALLSDSGFDIHGKPRRRVLVAPRADSVRRR